MNRRSFLAAPALALSAQPAAALLHPRALRPGNAVGLITPATYVSDPDSIALALRTIEYFGMKPKLGANVKKRNGYLGGSIGERIDDLHAMFQDPAVDAIFCIRGGYGSGQLLDRIDYGLIHRNPKIFVGYSDITAMHLAIQKLAGLVTFHGPVVMSRFTDFTQKHFRKALFETEPIGAVTNPPDGNPLRPAHTLRTVRPGSARGRLVGGNLSLIASLMGTPYEIDTRGKILFLEDVGEEPYSLDRMMTQLRLSGKLQAAAGVIFGECSGCRPREYRQSFESTFSAGEVVDAIFDGLTIPVLSGLTIGHTDDQLTLPGGVMAALDADKGILTIEEAGVA